MDNLIKLKIKNLFSVLLFSVFVFPFSVRAEAPGSFSGLVGIVVELLASVLPVLVLLALFYFLWGLAQYLKNAGEKNEEVRKIMLHGIIGLFIMLSVWGFMGLLSGTLGTPIQKPDLGTAESYLDGSQIKNELKERDSFLKNSLRELLGEPLENSKKTNDSESGNSQNTEEGAKVVEEGSGKKESNVPDWFKSIMPWNWF